MIVREARAEDFPQILEILNTENDEKIFTEDESLIVKSYVLDCGGSVLGTAVYYTQDKEHYVGIIVHKESRRKGLGSFLLKESLRLFGERKILARINKFNYSSKRFFKKNGFKFLRYEDEDEVYYYIPEHTKNI